MEKLTIYTLNAWSGLTYHGLPRMGEYEPEHQREARFQALLHDLCIRRPDVIFLNEANPMPAYAARLAKELQMDFCWHMGVAGLRVGALGIPANLREGDVILARPELRLTSLGRRRLSGPGFCGNIVSCHFSNMTQAVLCRVTLPQAGAVYLCCTHFTAHPALGAAIRAPLRELAARWGFSEREERQTLRRLKRLQRIKLQEAAGLLSFLNRRLPSDAKLLVAGDFNSELPWPEMQLLLKNGLSPVPRRDAGFTWDMTENGNLKRYYLPETEKKQPTLFRQLDAWDEQTKRNIDHILVRHIPVKACRAGLCARGTGGVFPSDHFGLYAQIALR